MPTKELSLDEERELQYKRVKRLVEYKILTDDALMGNPNLLSALNSALALYDVSVLVVGSLNTGVHILLT